MQKAGFMKKLLIVFSLFFVFLGTGGWLILQKHLEKEREKFALESKRRQIELDKTKKTFSEQIKQAPDWKPLGASQNYQRYSLKPKQGIGYQVWGIYERDNIISQAAGLPVGKWTWIVVLVDPSISKVQLELVAKEIFKNYPRQRVRIFNDDAQIKQFIDRDIYFNDSTGTVAPVDFPEDWVKAHHLANINDRSDALVDRWQLVTRKGEHLLDLE
jgi:asparagine synthetase A